MRTDVPEQNAPPRLSDALGYATHEVLNRPGSLADYDAYSDDQLLVEAVKELAAAGLSKLVGTPD